MTDGKEVAYALVGGIGGLERGGYHMLDCLVGFGDKVGSWEGVLVGENDNRASIQPVWQWAPETYSFSSCRSCSLRGGQK